MIRSKLLNVLLLASISTFAATAVAQQNGQQNNTPRNAPVGTTPAPAVGSPAAGSATTPSATSSGTMGSMGTTGSGTTGSAMDSEVPRDMTGYKSARSACDSGPATGKSQCISKLNTRYSSVDSKCAKLSGSGLDDCLKGADHGQ